MTSENHPAPAQPHPAPPRRAFAPDLARGFMLGLIAVANVTAYLWGSMSMTNTSAHPVGGSALDTVLSTLTILFVDGRIYPLFAFLFGYGIVQFARSRESAGDDPRAVRGMLVRRHLWLIVFGFAHALLLFAGDVLSTYGLAGLILGYALLTGTDRGLKITAWVLVAVFAGFSLIQAVIGVLGVLLGGAEDEVSVDSGFAEAMMDSVLTVGNGDENYFVAMAVRLGVWFLSTIMANVTLLVPLCVILGGLAARHRWIEPRDPGVPRRPGLGLVAGVGIGLGVIGALPQALTYLGWASEDVLPSLSLTGFNQLTGVAAGLGYAALFGLIGLRVQAHPPRWLLPVAYLGKRSLSFYLLQSVVFAPLLAAWGLGLGRTWNTTPAFALALGVWVVSLALATWLESRNSKGPAEVVLRRLTYGRSRRG